MNHSLSMNHPFSRFLSVSALLGLLISFPSVSPAQQMNYQGRLTDSAGNPLVDGQYNLTFNIYDAATDGTVLWGPFVCDGTSGNGKAPSADLVNGRFNVILGPLDITGRPLPDAFAGSAGAPRFLGIQVATNPEILPRQQFLAAPEALHAQVADTVIDSAIGTDQLADGSVTASKIAGGTAVWLSTGSTIYNLNDVAIGTDTSDQKLHVEGGMRLSGGAASNIYTDNDAGLYSRNTAGDDEQVLLGRSVDDQTMLTYGSGGLVIRNNANDQFIHMNDNGNVGIGAGTTNPPTKLYVDGSFAASSVNGEQPPYKFDVGDTNNLANWNSYEIPSEIVEQYLADDDGGTIRIILRENTTDQVRIIEEHIYIEQQHKSMGAWEGNHGWNRQLGGVDREFVLRTAAIFEIIPVPWDWIYIRNYNTRGLPGISGTNSGAFSDFSLEVLVVPNIYATIIVYDR